MPTSSDVLETMVRVNPVADRNQAARLRNRQFVARIRRRTVCASCGRQPIEWHKDGHRDADRVSSLVGRASSLARILAEIESCTAVCRRCHMALDGRLAAAAARARDVAPRLSGELNPVTKLSDADVAEIRVRYSAGGVLQRTLAVEFGVTQPLISLVVNRKTRN